MSVNLPNVQQPFVDQATGLVNRTWYLALLALNAQVVPDVVTSVNIIGLNGIVVSGGPITSSGVFSLGIGNLTAANAIIAGTVTAANAVITGTISAANVATGGMIASGTITAANVIVTGLLRAPRKASVLLTYINAAWTIFAPDGSLVSTAGTTTDGLQEAINYAQTNGYSLEVWGPGINAAGAMVARIDCTSAVTIGPAAYMDIIFKGCIIRWDTFNGDCLTFNTLDNCTVDMDCVLQRSGGVAGNSLVVFAPTTDEPQFGGNHFQQNKVFIRHLRQYNAGAPRSMVTFAPQIDRGIINNQFTFVGLDAGTFADNCIQVDNPILGGANQSAFNDNRITFGLCVNWTVRAIANGAAGLNPATQPLAANFWAGSIESTAAAGTDHILTYGFLETWMITSMDINTGAVTNGINFGGASATDNFFVCPQIVATTNQVVDAGARNTVFHDDTYSMVNIISTSTITAANVIVTGTLTAANVVATATVLAANIRATGTVTAADIVATATLLAANMRATGTLTAANVISVGAVNAASMIATGTITGANAVITQTVASVGIVATGRIEPSQTVGVLGTTTNNDANAGSIGEYKDSQVLLAANIALTTATATDITSIDLSGGDWDVWGSVALTTSGSTVVTNFGAWCSVTSATLPTAPNFGAETFFNLTFATGTVSIIPAGRKRFPLTTTTTVVLSTYVGFSAGGAGAYGFIGARRVR